jgi:hypothetical protein
MIAGDYISHCGLSHRVRGFVSQNDILFLPIIRVSHTSFLLRRVSRPHPSCLQNKIVRGLARVTQATKLAFGVVRQLA